MKTFFKEIFANTIKLLYKIKLGQLMIDHIATNSMSREISILYKSKTYNFTIPNSLNRWRVETFSTKEPETLEWIDGLEDNAVLWDIGANVGAYSLVGASLGFEVFAFEPAFQNYFKLHENISLNKMDKKINAFCIAFGKKTLIGDFNVFDFSYGTSRGNYNSENYFELKLDLVAQKKTLAFEIDKFIEFFNLKEPDLIKIDVDGGEFEILLGAVRLLKNSRRLKSILVEFDQNHNSFLNLKKFLKKHRWVIIEKYYRQPGVYNLILKKI